MRVARIAVVLACLAACSRRAPPPAGAPAEAGAFLTRTDDLGRTVTFARPPRRIVSLLPSHTETLYAIGAGSRLVGRDTFSDWPPEARTLPGVGGMLDVNVEAVAALAPDLVLCSEFGAQAATFDRLGIPTFAVSAQRYDDVFGVMRTVGALVGKSAEAEELVRRTEAEVRAVEAEAASRPRVRAYYEIDPTPYTVGPRSFVGVVLAKAGGDNVVPDGIGDFPKIGPELVVAADPEVILGVSLEEARRRPGWAVLRAVRAGRVVALPREERELVTRPGPRVAEAIRIVARYLHDAGPDAGREPARDAAKAR